MGSFTERAARPAEAAEFASTARSTLTRAASATAQKPSQRPKVAVAASGGEFVPIADTDQSRTGAETRIAPRKNGATPALAVFETAPSGTPCTIIDMSATGARLKFPQRGTGHYDPNNIPDRFWLQIKLDRMQVECEIIRRDGVELGVRFCSTPVAMAKVIRSKIVKPSAKGGKKH